MSLFLRFLFLFFLLVLLFQFYTLRVSPPAFLGTSGSHTSASEVPKIRKTDARGGPGEVLGEPGGLQKQNLKRRDHQEGRNQFTATPWEAKTLQNNLFFIVCRGSGQGSKDALGEVDPPNWGFRGGGKGEYITQA